MSNEAKINRAEKTDSDGDRKRLKVIRQDRKSVDDFNCILEIGNAAFRVVNVSPFGLLVKTESIFSNDFAEGVLVFEDVDLGGYKLKKIRDQFDEHGNKLIAFEVVGEPISIDRLHAIRDAHSLIKHQNAYQETTLNIPDTFSRKVYEVKDWLEELNRTVTDVEVKFDKSDKESFFNYETTVVQVIGDYLNSILPIKNKDLSKYLRDYNPDTQKACYQFFREKLKEIIYQAPFANRVYYKPLGYAGDYEMMNIIYRDEPEGKSLFAKCLHEYWVKQPAASAVRNRADYIQTKILEMLGNRPKDKLSILSVASGPAFEWQKLLSSDLDLDRVEVNLLDQDDGALKHSQKKIKEIQNRGTKKTQFNYIHKAIKHILARGLDKKYDLIYSAGLFDYFSDPVAQLAGQRLFECLNPGGQLILGNFNVENPNSIIMDLALDWHLVYRTEQDLHRLFGHQDANVEVEKESLNINLFCVITKK